MKIDLTRPNIRWKSMLAAGGWLAAGVFIFAAGAAVLIPRARAATSGQTILYLKKEPSDINATYNALSLSNGDTRADTASGTTSTTNVNASPPTSFCESSNITGETFTQVSAAATSTGERCIATFISLPVGKTFSMSTGDAASISANIYSSESTSQVTSRPTIYIYRWNGSGTTVSTSDLIASWSGTTCADPGTTPTLCTVAQTPVSPAHNISFIATDRIVVIVGQNITRSRSGQYVSNYFDNSSRSPSASIKLGYDITTPNKPSLTGSLDDDFANAQGNTTCSGAAYDIKWTCPAPSAANSSADINSADMSPSGGDSSSWLVLRNQCPSCTVSNFGTTPSNAFIYQALPGGYGDGSVSTVVNSALSYQIGATTPASPYNHAGLVLWSSNTDYLELQLYSTGVKSTTNTVKVAVNNSGTIGTAANINTTTTAGTFGRVWLRFSNTGGAYQGQYSTDGSTWTNVGTAVTHSLFSRTGLNAFAAVSGANYSGAFDWFQYTFAAPTYSQTSYQWLANANSTVPGAKLNLVAQNTATTLASAGQQFRLRQLIKIGGQIGTGYQSFNEQYADLSTYSACSAISPGNWLSLSAGGSSGGPNYAGSGTNDASIGNTAWSNPGNITSDDGAYSNTGLASGSSTNYLLAENFGFSIPSTATILGISVDVKKADANYPSSTAVDNAVRLVKGGSIQTFDESNTSSGWPTSFTYASYGGTSDLWGGSWTPADINSSGFGFAISAKQTKLVPNVQVDTVRITVIYSVAGGGQINYYDNSTPASGAGISATANDPTDSGQTVSPQTYQEADGFSNVSSLGGTTDGEWDLSLYDNGAPPGTAYCFRTVKSDGTPLDTYTNYPMIRTTPSLDMLMRGGQYFSGGSKQSFYWAN